MASRTTRYPSRLNFVVDLESLVRNSGRQIDWARIAATDTDFIDDDGKKAIPAGTVMAEVGGKLVPRGVSQAVTAAIDTNVATITLEAHGLAVGDEVYVTGATPATINGLHTVESVPDADSFTFAATGDDGDATGTIALGYSASGILVSDAVEDDKSASLSGYGVLIGGVLYDNLLPDATGTPKVLPAAYKTELNAGVTGFVFEQYVDSRTS